MKRTTRELASVAIVFLIVVFGVAYLRWRFERWVNWRWDYGGRVEQRIGDLEERVEQLEARK
jgi:hypothetical protein